MNRCYFPLFVCLFVLSGLVKCFVSNVMPASKAMFITGARLIGSLVGYLFIELFIYLFIHNKHKLLKYTNKEINT